MKVLKSLLNRLKGISSDDWEDIVIFYPVGIICVIVVILAFHAMIIAL